MNQLSDIFKAGLKQTKYSQAKAAELIGIERKTFNTYVNGKREPEFEILKKIISVLKIEKEICSLLMEQFVPTETSANMADYSDDKNIEAKYLALLEKNNTDKDKVIDKLLMAVDKITIVDNKVERLNITVGALQHKWQEYEPTILGLREFVTGEIASLKKKSHEEVAAALNIKVEEQQKKVEQSYTQKG